MARLFDLSNQVSPRDQTSGTANAGAHIRTLFLPIGVRQLHDVILRLGPVDSAIRVDRIRPDHPVNAILPGNQQAHEAVGVRGNEVSVLVKRRNSFGCEKSAYRRDAPESKLHRERYWGEKKADAASW